MSTNTEHFDGYRNGNLIWLANLGEHGEFVVFPGEYQDDSGKTTPKGIIHDQAVALRRIREACDTLEPNEAVDAIRSILGVGRRYTDEGQQR